MIIPSYLNQEYQGLNLPRGLVIESPGIISINSQINTLKFYPPDLGPLIFGHFLHLGNSPSGSIGGFYNYYELTGVYTVHHCSVIIVCF